MIEINDMYVKLMKRLGITSEQLSKSINDVELEILGLHDELDRLKMLNKFLNREELSKPEYDDFENDIGVIGQ